jgi:hypothetical protein
MAGSNAFIAAMLDFPLLDSLCERLAHGLDGRLGEIAVAFRAGARDFGLERLLAGMKDPHEFGFATEVQQHGQREASKLHTVSASPADRIINIDSARSAELVNRQFYVSLRGLGSMRGSIPIAPKGMRRAVSRQQEKGTHPQGRRTSPATRNGHPDLNVHRRLPQPAPSRPARSRACRFAGDGLRPVPGTRAVVEGAGNDVF